MDSTKPRIELADRDLGTVQRIDQGGTIAVRVDGKQGEDHHVQSAPNTALRRRLLGELAQLAGADLSACWSTWIQRYIPSLINGRFAYDSVSRAAHDAQVFTNHAANLAESLRREVSKTWAVTFSNTESRVPTQSRAG